MAKRPGVSVTSRFIAVKDQHSTLYTIKKDFASVFMKFFLNVDILYLLTNEQAYLSRFSVNKTIVII
jgi:hypothetical protein